MSQEIIAIIIFLSFTLGSALALVGLYKEKSWAIILSVILLGCALLCTAFGYARQDTEIMHTYEHSRIAIAVIALMFLPLCRKRE